MNRELVCKKILAASVGIILGLIFLYLGWYSFKYTYYFTLQYDESMVETGDFLPLHLLTVVLVIGIFGGVRWLTAHFHKHIKMICLGYLLVVMAVMTVLAFRWVGTLPTAPGADQYYIYNATQEILDGNYATLSPDGYLGRYRFQIGLMQLFKWLFQISGNREWKVICYANAVCVPIIILAGYVIIKTCYDKAEWLLVYCTAMLLCLPLLFYTPFVYGEVFFMALGSGMTAILLLLLKTKKTWLILPVIVLAVLAVWAKGTGWILIIAAVIVTGLYAIRRRSGILFLCALLLVAAPLSANKLLTLHYEKVSGIAIEEGIPSIAWIAMGIHAEGERRGGWYDGYNQDTYMAFHCDREKTAAASREFFAERLKELSENPKEFVTFYKNKTLTQWNVPLYESLSTNNLFYEELPPLAEQVYYGKLHWFCEGFMNEYHLFLCLGILFAAVGIFGNRERFFHTLPGIILIGSFLFSVIWEAKARYIFPSLPFMVMTAVYGWGNLTECGFALKERLKGKKG